MHLDVLLSGDDVINVRAGSGSATENADLAERITSEDVRTCAIPPCDRIVKTSNTGGAAIAFTLASNILFGITGRVGRTVAAAASPSTARLSADRQCS